jgi:ribosomal protein S18 acetylase RimI-like enzyme
MAVNGNKEQWGDNYPPRTLIEEDINTGKCYLAVDEKVCGVFYFAIENDPMYNIIEDGQWLNDNQYAVVHRIAVSKNTHNKGIAGQCINYAVEVWIPT